MRTASCAVVGSSFRSQIRQVSSARHHPPPHVGQSGRDARREEPAVPVVLVSSGAGEELPVARARGGGLGAAVAVADGGDSISTQSESEAVSLESMMGLSHSRSAQPPRPYRW